MEHRTIISITILFITVILKSESIIAVNENHQKISKLRKSRYIWTNDLNAKLVDIWQKTNPLRKGHEQRMHQAWATEVPQYKNISSKLLKDRAHNLVINRIKAEDLPNFDPTLVRRNFHWTPQQDLELIRIYNSTKPGPERGQQIIAKLKETYELDENLTPKYILSRAKRLRRLRFNKKNDELNNDFSMKRVKWSQQESIDAMKIWHKTYMGKNIQYSQTMYREWRKLHPKPDGVTTNKLFSHTHHLINKGFTIPAEHNEGVPIRIDRSVKDQRDLAAEAFYEMEKQPEFNANHLQMNNDYHHHHQFDAHKNSHPSYMDSYYAHNAESSSQIQVANLSNSHHEDANSQSSIWNPIHNNVKFEDDIPSPISNPYSDYRIDSSPSSQYSDSSLHQHITTSSPQLLDENSHINNLQTNFNHNTHLHM